MNYLAIDTSGNHLTVAARGKKSVLIYREDVGLRHSVTLMDAVEQCLSEAELTLRETEVFACATGPGSFTGIRIGVATVKAFAYANAGKVLPVTSFEALAYNAGKAGSRLALIDAGHGYRYVCGFNGENEVVFPPAYLPDGEIVSLAKDYASVLVPSPYGFPGEIVSSVGKGFVAATEAKLGLASEDREILVPLYVRKSQAEENAEGKEKT